MRRVIRRRGNHGLARLREERGGVAVMLALLMPLLFGAAAIGIDSAAVWSARQQVLSGADAAVLAVATDCARGNCGNIKKTAEDAFWANDLAAKLSNLGAGEGWISTRVGVHGARQRHPEDAVEGQPLLRRRARPRHRAAVGLLLRPVGAALTQGPGPRSHRHRLLHVQAAGAPALGREDHRRTRGDGAHRRRQLHHAGSERHVVERRHRCSGQMTEPAGRRPSEGQLQDREPGCPGPARRRLHRTPRSRRLVSRDMVIPVWTKTPGRRRLQGLWLRRLSA